MPRRSNADTIEKSEARAAELGDRDDNGLERLPEFETSSKVSNDPDFSDTPTQAREAQLAELDARDERLNGHSDVRPSEQCGVVAGSGPYPGKRCTYAEHPHNQPHSWEVTSEPDAELPGHVYDDSEQATLPGTPEPVQNEYTVPTESSFGKAKLQPAPGLKVIAERLIADDDTLKHLVGVEIRYAWRRRGGMQGGNPRYARIKRPSVYEEYLTGGKVAFFLDLSADMVREHRFTERQIEACVYDMLARTERDEDDHDAFRIRDYDFKGNVLTYDRYGAWEPSLREAEAHMAKTPLEEAIDETADADQSEDAGENDD